MNKELEAIKSLGEHHCSLMQKCESEECNIPCYECKYLKKEEIIEKGLRALEIVKNKNIDLKTLKTASICEADNKKQCEIYNANRWRWVEDNDFYGSSSVPSEDILEKEYDLLKEVLL